jgi:hypothetical protein
LLVCATFAASLAAGALASAAYAGQWMQVSCVNPDGSTAPSWGWTDGLTGALDWGSNASTGCSNATPMGAYLSSLNAAETGSEEYLLYTPPATSTLVGGSVSVGFTTGNAGGAWGVAWLGTPGIGFDGADVFSTCEGGYGGTCANFTGSVGIPDRTDPGDLYVVAECGGAGGAYCTTGDPADTSIYSQVNVYSADLLLGNSSQPTGTGFSGSLLDPGAYGTAQLLFTAADPDGPGVYKVIVQIDGTSVYDGTPNTNGGECASVGTDPTSGAYMFDNPQPCLQSEAVDLPIDTTQLTDGPHELKVQVEDAAQNTSTVMDQTITTANQTTVSSLLPTPPSSSSVASPVYAFALSAATSALNGSVHRAYNHSALTLSGTLDSSSGVAAPGVTVSLWASPANGSTFSELEQTTTDGAGLWSLTAPAGSSRVLRVVASAGALPTSAASSVSVTETVTPTLSLKVATPGRARLVFSGKLAISPLGAPRPLVLIEVHAASGWQAVGAPVRVAADGRYRYVYPSSPLLIGHRFAFRATTAATSLWQTGLSPVEQAVLR